MANDDNIVEIACKLYERDQRCWSEIYEKGREDLRFLSDEPGAQWDDRGYQARRESGRPALTVDQLSQFVHQVANEIRKNTPAITAVPVEDSDQEKADAVKEWMRGIEYRSLADDAYDTAALFAIRCSIGFIRVDHDYCRQSGFEQELLIKRVTNPFAILLDSDSVECDGRDAKHGFALETMHVDEFAERYPEFAPVSFGASNTDKPQTEGDVVIAEFFRIKKEYSETKEGKKARKTCKCTVERYKLSGRDVLEKTTFPGEYIPIVPVYGEELWIDGKRHLMSLIRKAKDGQMMFNLWKSLEAELLMQQPRSPIMVAEGQIAGYEDGYLNPGSKAVLTYRQRDIEGNPASAPQRLSPPTIPTGMVNAAKQSVDDIKATMGLYDASIGARSNETSGIAIARRQMEGQNATFHFADNLTRSITQVARILESARADIYDTPRIVPGIDSEDRAKLIGINGEITDGQKQTYDFTKGRHEVRVTTSQSFATKREESAAFLTDLVNKQPQMMQVMGDLLFKYMDVAGAEAMAERMKKVIPANLTADDDQQDPEKMQMMQAIQEMQAQLQQAQAALAEKQTETQLKAGEIQGKLQIEQAKLQLDQQKLALDAEKVQNDRLKIEIEAQKMMQPQEMPQQSMNLPNNLQVTKTPDALAMEDSHHQQEMAMQEQALLMEAQQAQAQIQMTAAVIEAVNGVQTKLAELTDSISRPKNVVYDNNGMITGVR
jgi:hypothetical protein